MLAAYWALESGEVDRVLVVPTARHAFGKVPGASFEERLALCRIAFARLPEVEISDIEGRRDGVSYMIDTLEQLAAERPGYALRLIVGTDVARDLPKWRRGADVLRIAPPLLLPRPQPGARFDDHPGSLPPISSSQVRECLHAGADARHLLSANVLRQIRERQLYLPQPLGAQP
jgi:nicotinate-nucleotide adenylyltransferase